MDDGAQSPVRLTVIYRRAYDECIRFAELFRDSVAYIIIKNTLSQPFGLSLSTGYTTTDRLVTNPNNFALNTLMPKLFRYFCQCDSGIPMLAGATIDK